MTKFVETIKSINPLYVIPVLLVIALIVAGIFIFGGGGGGGEEEGAKEPDDPSLGFAEGDRSRLPGRRLGRVKRAPIVRTGLLDEARRTGRLAVAQARGQILSPGRVQIRVSAAPKQTVTVNWQLGCFINRRARIGRGRYRARPPDIRAVRLPVQGATSCIVTAGAQLTDPDRRGRVKVAVIAG